MRNYRRRSGYEQSDFVNLGSHVLYRSKIDNGEGNDVSSPAIVIRTKSTTLPAVTERWADSPTDVHAHDGTVHTTAARPPEFVAELPDDRHVDLVVFGLGKTYREYNVAYGPELGQWYFGWEEDD
jgi:hypothetical protein